MTGNALKQEIIKRGYTIKSIALMMKTSPQNLSGKLTSDNVTTGLMEEVAALMGVDVVEFYGHTTGDNISAAYNSTAFKGNPSCDPRLLDLIANRDRQIEKLQHQISILLESLNELRIENQQLFAENANLKARLSILCKDEENDKNS